MNRPDRIARRRCVLALVAAGFTRASAVAALDAKDFRLLVHTGEVAKTL